MAMNGKAGLAGTNVQALATNVEAVNRPIALSLRPGRVQLNPTLSALSKIFRAEIAEVIYLGNHVRTYLSVYGQDDFVIKLPNSESLGQLESGAAVKVGGPSP